MIKRILELKSIENAAKDERQALEIQLAKTITGPDEGTAKAEIASYMVTVTRKLTRTIDFKKYEELKPLIPDGLSPVIFKPELDLKKLRAIESVNPGMAIMCSRFITSKPAKPSIKIERIENGN
jgi:hypothetical protein